MTELARQSVPGRDAGLLHWDGGRAWVIFKTTGLGHLRSL